MYNKEMIKDYIMLNNNVSVAEICEKFDMSESTVRRILVKLEDRKIIKRYHGGAYPLVGNYNPESMDARISRNWDKKIAIAKSASSFVEEGSTVILFGGTTVYAMCRYLKGKKLTVITNSLIAFSELMSEKNMKIILLGGLFNQAEYELGGVITNSGMRNIRADYMFMGAYGFDIKQGYTTRDIDSLELYQTCIVSSNKVFVVTDSSKYKAGGTAVTAKHEDVHCLITDDGIDSEFLAAMSNRLKIVVVGKD